MREITYLSMGCRLCRKAEAIFSREFAEKIVMKWLLPTKKAGD